MTQLLPPKKEVALALLERSNVDVYLDPRAKGVVVPPQFRKEPRLILKIGLNMPVPIPDLRLDDESMSCTLSFNRSPFYCVVPWTSVFAMVGEDGRGMVWPDDVPQELAVKVVDPNDAGGRAAASRPESPSATSGSSGASGASGSSGSSGSSGTAADRARRGARGGNRERLGSAPRASEEAAPDRSDRARGGKSRKKKKEEVGRPVLVAVPSSTDRDRDRDQRSEKDRDQDRREAREAAGDRPRDITPDSRRPPSSPDSRQPGASAERRDGVSPVPSAPNGPSSRPRQPVPPSARRPDGVARPKRELPPYLRVVK